MKLSNLSLAVLSAIALAACGSSGNDNQTTDPGAGAGSTPPKQITPPKDEKKDEKKDDQQNAAAKDKEIVNPTEDKVVDNIDLSDTSTTASQQYIRGEKSNYDNQANPSEPASTTVLSGITLDKQNPNLTNIVIARPQGTNKDGDLVKIAQFVGSQGNKFTSSDTLQHKNEDNALVNSGFFKESTLSEVYANYNKFAELSNSATVQSPTFNLNPNNGFVNGSVGVFANPLLENLTGTLDSTGTPVSVNYAAVYLNFIAAKQAYDDAYAAYMKNPQNKSISGGTGAALETALKALVDIGSGSAIDTTAAKVATKKPLNILLAVSGKQYPKFLSDNKVSADDVSLELIKDTNAIDGTLASIQDSKNIETVKVNLPNFPKLEKFGFDKYVFATSTGNTINYAATGDNHGELLLTQGWGDVVDSSGKKVVGVAADNSVDQGGPTHGLVGIWKHSDGNYYARGTDDNNIRGTRIFGHFYRTPDGLNTENPSEGANSWNGAGVIFTGVNAKGDINKYGLAANPIRLNDVQYGRVTAKIEDVNFGKEAKSQGWKFEQQKIVERDPEHKDDSVDFYFYRGTNATSIKDMASLPTDAEVLYRGHALMYGIDNNFHGAGDVLPNAFGVAQSYGLGNFVEAHLDMGKQKLTGNIYNAWHSPESDKVYQDNLVNFEGKVVGNTAYGTAELAYDASADKGIFKGSFFGAKAKELGGSVNSVTDKDVYGKGKWGGVFGAQRVGGGTGSAWLVSSQAK